MAQSLYLIRGLPGAGKSTFANTLLDAYVVQHVFEADNYFIGVDGVYRFDPHSLGKAHDQCFDKTKDALERGLSVAVSNTFTTEREMQRYVDLAKEHNINLVSLIVENRHGNQSVHDVPVNTLRRMRDRFDVQFHYSPGIER